MNVKESAVPFILGCLLAACVQSSASDAEWTVRGASIRVWKDPDTNCEYLVSYTGYTAAITPRLNDRSQPKGCLL